MPNVCTRKLERSWIDNADAWIDAVRGQRIESRRVVTDAAILEAVIARNPGRALDVGCGEGWLCRALGANGIEAVGVDGSPPLIEAAREAKGGSYHLVSYADLAGAAKALGRFDVIICNFSLLDAEPAPLLETLRAFLDPEGALIIQTAHPWTVKSDRPYRDGWRTETFETFPSPFVSPMPWFFRTLQSWLETLRGSGWRLENLVEPVHPQTGLPASLLLTVCCP